jgi:hypothetical protein
MPQGREREYDPQCQQECVALVTLRGEMRVQEKILDDLVHDLRGNGNAGFLREAAAFQKEARDFFVDHRAREEERAENLRKSEKAIKEALDNHYVQVAADNAVISNKISKKNFWVGLASFFVALAGIAIAGAALAATIYLAKHSEVRPENIFKSSAPVVASSQDAGAYPTAP